VSKILIGKPAQKKDENFIYEKVEPKPAEPQNKLRPTHSQLLKEATLMQ